MDRILTVEITPQDFRDAPKGYRNTELGQKCVLWYALRRMFPQSHIHVGPWHVVISPVEGGKKTYEIDNNIWGVHSMEPSDTKYHPTRIDELSEKAKESLEGIPTVSLTLTQFIL